MNKKNNILLFLCVAIFGIVGIYLTFFLGNTNKYDGQTVAYKIEPNEQSDSDGTVYYPIYYFKVRGKTYQCKSKTGSSFYPKENKNKVYFDSKNPKKCTTQYEKSSGYLAGIICLAVSVVMLVLIIKKPSVNTNDYHSETEPNMKDQVKIQESIEKATEMVEKIQLIVKRVILGFIIIILLVIVLFESIIVKQTIKAKDYVETTATYVEKKEDYEDHVFDDYIYTFEDKQGKQQEIIISVSENSEVSNTIKIKYNEKNPQDFYEEGATYEKSGMIWYVVKIFILIVLIILFFNKKLLSKTNLSFNVNS